MRWVLTLVVVGACYSPTIPTGALCDQDHPCPRPLICAQTTGTCERSEIDADTGGADDAPDAPPIPGCMPTGFDVCGDAIDQDCDGSDEVCAANDLAAGALDVTAGGSFSGDLFLARDHAAEVGCGGDGGRDLFYKITLSSPQVYYFDTFGSNFDVTVRVFPAKACTALAATDSPTCNDDSCNSADSQLALQLPAGTSCVVVDQNMAATTAMLTLNVMPGGHNGRLLLPGPRTLTNSNTCTLTDTWKPACAGDGGKEDAYFFTVCPGVTAHVDASSCNDVAATHFDTVLMIRKAGVTTALACEDDDASCAARPDRPDTPDGAILTNVAVPGPGLFFLALDGYDAGSCGSYSMTTNLR